MKKDGKEGELYTVPYKFGAGDRRIPVDANHGDGEAQAHFFTWET